MAWGNMMSYFSLPNFRAIFQGRVRQAGMQTHTIKSHGAKIARDHLHDWLILLLLVVIEVILFVMHPFYRFVGKDMMTDLKYPLKGNTVPVWTVPLYAVLLPVAVFLLVYIRRKDVYDLHHSILGLLFSVLITAVITDAIKNALGWPRPDFFWRCFPDGKELFDRWGNVICHGKGSDVKEGHKSFPSGHTSSFQVVSVFKRRYLKNSLSQPIKISAATYAGSFAGLGFLSLYLSGKIKAFDRKGHVAKLCIVFLPLLAASLVAISRVDDYWHHWEDVFAGGLLGLIVSAFCYSQFFPPPYNDDGWGPYAYFQALEESRATTNAGQSMNALNSQPMNALVVSQQGRQNGDDLAPLEELESGRM